MFQEASEARELLVLRHSLRGWDGIWRDWVLGLLRRRERLPNLTETPPYKCLILLGIDYVATCIYASPSEIGLTQVVWISELITGYPDPLAPSQLITVTITVINRPVNISGDSHGTLAGGPVRKIQ